jgi:hypothetical protein
LDLKKILERFFRSDISFSEGSVDVEVGRVLDAEAEERRRRKHRNPPNPAKMRNAAMTIAAMAESVNVLSLLLTCRLVH